MIKHQIQDNFGKPGIGAGRQGTILLLTLVVVSGLALSALAFTQSLILELDAARATQRQADLRRLADSGLEAVAAELESRHSAMSVTGTQSASRLRDVAVVKIEGGTGRFTIQNELEPKSPLAAEGYCDESSKLNLNALPLDAYKRKVTRERLTQLPDMTPAIADAILDWMDEDSEPSEFGAEAAWYFQQDPPRVPRNGRLQSLNELLQVRGVTSELLYGTGTDRGWSQYLTIHGAESNLRPDGQPRINLNDEDLVALYDALHREFNEETARFIVAWRLAGTTTGSESRREEPRKSRKDIREAARKRLARQLDAARGSSSAAEGGSAPDVTRGGLDLSREPAYQIRSIYDLVDVNVRIDVERRDTVLKSPWKADIRFLERQLPELESRLSVSGERRIVGRINLNLAPPEVLRTVPGIDADIARRIAATRQRLRIGTDNRGSHSTTAWLLTERILDLGGLRMLAPWLTDQGDVVSGLSIGHISGSDTAVAVEFTIDGTSRRARILQRYDLPPFRLTNQ